MRSVNKNIVLIIILALFVSSCVSYSTLHSPETLEPGKIGIHGGAAVIVSDDFEFGLLPEAGIRMGIVKNLDIGFKYSIPNTFMLDAKYQFLRGPVNAIADIGVSIFPFGEIITFAYYPTLIFEFKKVYIGAKYIFGNINDFGGFFGINESFLSKPVLITGLAIGKNRAKLLLEVNTYFGQDFKSTLFIPAVGALISFK